MAVESRLVDNYLDRIERIEHGSLVWGFTEGGLSRDEAVGLASLSIKEVGGNLNPDDLVEEMIEARLLFECRTPIDGGTLLIRSRYAETVRLLSRLRQIFPGRRWDTAPRLVSDFRVDWRPRRYPARVVPPEEAWTQATINVPGLTDLHKKAFIALLTKNASLLNLSNFQIEATQSVLSGKGSHGTIVTSGTGSGKTLCFYLPVLTRLAGVVREGEFWTKALAIYPRTELLKDQFAEAYDLARRLDPILATERKRPIRIGALYGSTPNRAQENDIKNKGWKGIGIGYVCPYMRCPACEGEFAWTRQDISRGVERLVCTKNACRTEVTGERVPLTRQALQDRPPDILFTTAEMLNRRLSDPWMNKALFGVGKEMGRRPIFLLLDEVHTYPGILGAHVAILLRRYRHALRSDIAYVGLSATLESADNFFSQLIGIPKGVVRWVKPQDADLLEESAEYQVILRGDPASRTALLSTSIQSTMLLGRIMDPPGTNISEGRYGERLFVFTDDLDVTNRLYDDLRDAEGYPSPGKRASNPLANLRSEIPDPAENRRKYFDGQRWGICERIGRSLSGRINVGRTTSRDVGVESGMDVVVATSALEVGFDDPGVGGVIQHKAPRDMASYLQRKGRAGRPRRMRPFLVTILSDYGRDRLAFQSYEKLFDPTLRPRSLPIMNQYLLRAQAVFAMFDWLSKRLGVLGGWPWDTLSRPAVNAYTAERQKRILELLTSLIEGDTEVVQALAIYLEKALSIPVEVVQDILWGAPRPFMLEVVPTIVRRLERQWSLATPRTGGDFDLIDEYRPVPEFIPTALFGELGLTEILVEIPPNRTGMEPGRDAMPLVQGLNHLVPGRVTRRFAHERSGLCHWIPINYNEDDFEIPIPSFAPQAEFVGEFPIPGPDPPMLLPVYRPWVVQLQNLNDATVLPTSNATLEWLGSFDKHGDPLSIPVPERGRWKEIVRSADFHLHAFRAAVRVRRWTPMARSSVRTRGGKEHRSRIRFLDGQGRPAGLGFELEVDGFVLEVALPSAIDLALFPLTPAVSAGLRSAYFRRLVLEDEGFPEEINFFQRDWIQQIFLSAIIARSNRDGIGLKNGVERLVGSGGEEDFQTVMDAIFSIQEAKEEEVGDAADDDEEVKERAGKLGGELTRLLSIPGIVGRLGQLASVLWEDVPDGWGEYLARVALESLTESVLEACIRCVPEHASTETLLADLEVIQDGDSSRARIWISEMTQGGAGVLEALMEAVASEPARFFRSIETALAPSDSELVAIGLRRFVSIAARDEQVASLISDNRKSLRHIERESLRRILNEALLSRGVPVGRDLNVSLNARFLRTGMDRDGDRLLEDMLAAWEELEQRLRVLVPLRVYSYIAATDPRFAARIRQMIPGGDRLSLADIVPVLVGLLFPRANEIRRSALDSYNPFRAARDRDPALIREIIAGENPTEIPLRDGWEELFRDVMARSGICRLITDAGQESLLRSAIVRAIASPVDVGFLQLYPVVEQVEKNEGTVSALLGLQEIL